jgi:hypothetical protein
MFVHVLDIALSLDVSFLSGRLKSVGMFSLFDPCKGVWIDSPMSEPNMPH